MSKPLFLQFRGNVLERTSLALLKAVAKKGDITLAEAINLLPKAHGTHRDMYPLVHLIESDFLGITVNFQPPQGADRMREYNSAISIYMLILDRSEDGIVSYNGVESSGSMRAENETVFLKAKGALHLGELLEKRRDRIVFLILGLLAGLVAVFAKEEIQRVYGG